MELRIRSAANQAAGIRDDSIARLIGHDAAAARDSRDRWTPVVIVRNPAARVRSGVAVIDVEQFVADVPVGPGSAPATSDREVAVVRARSRACPALGALQVLSRRLAYSRTESPHHYPDNDLVSVAQVAAWVSDAPAYGIASYPIGDESSGKRRAARVARRIASRSLSRRFGMRTLEVAISDAGVVSLEHLASGRRIDALLELVDERDVGDLYTPAPRDRPFRVLFRGVRRVHRGPLRGELAANYRIVDEAQPKNVFADVSVHLTLDAGREFLRVVDRRRQPRRKPSRSPRGARRRLRRERLGGCGVRPGAPRTNRRR